MQWLKHFIYRCLDWECCGEWTQWEDCRGRYIRPTEIELDGTLALKQDTVEYTRRWQERKCTLCGRIQQRDLRQ